MKNLKVVFTFLPVMAIAIFIYFSATAYVPNTEVNQKSGLKLDNSKINSVNTKTSGSASLPVYLTDLGSNHCLSGDYTYCVNGGPPRQVFTDDFEVEVPCNESVTICVKSSTGCYGSWTGSVACPAIFILTIDLSPTNPRCECEN